MRPKIPYFLEAYDTHNPLTGWNALGSWWIFWVWRVLLVRVLWVWWDHWIILPHLWIWLSWYLILLLFLFKVQGIKTTRDGKKYNNHSSQLKCWFITKINTIQSLDLALMVPIKPSAVFEGWNFRKRADWIEFSDIYF